jgi:hypothetical protein
MSTTQRQKLKVAPPFSWNFHQHSIARTTLLLISAAESDAQHPALPEDHGQYDGLKHIKVIVLIRIIVPCNQCSKSLCFGQCLKGSKRIIDHKSLQLLNRRLRS